MKLFNLIDEAKLRGLHIVALQELGLEGDEKLVLQHPWQLFNANRPVRGNHRKPGGGVGLLVNMSCGYAITPVDCPPSDSELERIWIKIDTKSGSLFVCSLYWPPRGKAAAARVCATLRGELQRWAPLGDIVLLGDLNAHVTCAVRRQACSRGAALERVFAEFNLTLRNTREVTHTQSGCGGSLIDLIVASASVHTEGIDVSRVLDVDGHRLVSCRAPRLRPNLQKKIKRIRLDKAALKDADKVATFHATLGEIAPDADVGAACAKIMATAIDIFGTHQPKKQLRQEGMPEWWTDELQALKNEKIALFKQSILTPAERERVSKLTKQTRHLVQIATKKHRLEQLQDVSERLLNGGDAMTRRFIAACAKENSIQPTATPSAEDNRKYWSSIFANKDDAAELKK